MPVGIPIRLWVVAIAFDVVEVATKQSSVAGAGLLELRAASSALLRRVPSFSTTRSEGSLNASHWHFFRNLMRPRRANESERGPVDQLVSAPPGPYAGPSLRPSTAFFCRPLVGARTIGSCPPGEALDLDAVRRYSGA